MFPDYPFTSHRLDLDGFAMHYLDEGPRDAPAVVMLHGNPTWSFYYRHMVAALRDRYHCIVPDHVGMGLSDKPGDDRYDYRLASRAADVERLLEAVLPSGPVTLMLHDWGGMIGMTWAASHAERVSRLVLLNTAGFGLPAGKSLPWQLRLARAGWLGELLVRSGNAFALGAALTCVKRRPMPADVRRAYLAPYDSWAHRIAVARFVQRIPLQPGDDEFELIEQTAAAIGQFADRPALIAWGMRDFVFDRTFLDEWRRRLPKAEVHRFEDAGHYVLEDAADQIVPLVERFLERKA